MILSSLRSPFALGLIVGYATLVCTQTLAQPAGSSENDERFRGLVTPNKQVVISAPLDGIVAEILVEEGDEVEQGELVVRMNDAIQRVAVLSAKLQAEAKAEIRQARLALEEAEILLEKIQDAFEGNAASEWEVRRTRLQRDQAEAALEAAHEQKTLAQENLNLERERLARYRLTAPFTGRVIRTIAEQGATLAQTEEMIMIAQLDPLEGQLFLPVELYGELQVGATYQLEAEDPVNQQLTGKLKTIDPMIDAASRTFRCVFTIENPESKLPAGFTVRLVWPQ